MTKLTARQQQVLDFIRGFIDTEGMPPTRVDIARALGFRSPNAAEDHLRALDRKGAIELVPGSSRGIRLPEEPGLPLVGQVAAGYPILAEQNIEARFQCETAMFHPQADYLLRVQGMSMKDIGILDGDLLAVHRTPEARNGQVVVVRLGDEVTVKRFKKRGNKVWLLPENPEFKPIEVDLRHEPLDIEGLGVGVIRNGSPL